MDDDLLPKVSDNSDINDVRTPPQFKGISFSKFKKTDVRKQMIENIKKGKLEPSCYWCAELICGGHFMEVWEIILIFLQMQEKLLLWIHPESILLSENHYQMD